MKTDLEYLLDLLETLSGKCEEKDDQSDFVRGMYAGEKMAYDVAIKEVERILKENF